MKKTHKKHPPSRQNNSRAVAKASELRVIGGEWRSRKLSFFAIEGLRPTLDRVRETAFNWLAPTLTGATCLDLFAGSGALSFEALSRGATFVHINELNNQVRKTLLEQLNLLKCEEDRFTLSGCDGSKLSDAFCDKQFDLIFLDPPFRKEILEACCANIAQLDLLKEDGQIYLESEVELTQLILPKGWQVIKQKKAGQTHYGLVEIAVW